MKKLKQVSAILVCIFLLSLYLFTLILAIIGNPGSKNLFLTSIYATVIIPVLIWIYTFVYKLMKDHRKDNQFKDELKQDQIAKQDNSKQ